MFLNSDAFLSQKENYKKTLEGFEKNIEKYLKQIKLVFLDSYRR